MTDQMAAPDITSDDKLWACLSYVFAPVIPIIVLLMEDKKARKYIKFHAVQSLAVDVILIVLSTVTFGCGTILILVMFYWAYKAYQGEYFDIPVITNFIKGQGWV